MKINRQGSTRIVFVFKSFVIKIPNFLKGYNLFLRGLFSNVQERKASKANYFIPKGESLAKVLFSCPFGFWLIMEKAITVEEILRKHYNEHYKPTWERFCDLEENFYRVIEYKFRKDEFMLWDLRINNWGFIGNRLVKVDYGD